MPPITFGAGCGIDVEGVSVHNRTREKFGFVVGESIVW